MNQRIRDGARGAVEKLQTFVAEGAWREGDRLPSERDLADRLGVSRGSLRLALATLESEGTVWRRIGKGTFVGRRAPATADQLASQLANLSNPTEVTEARALIEPRLASLAAIRGNQQSFAQLRDIVRKGLAATDPQQSHRYNEELHHAIARIARNSLLQGLFETLFRVRSLTSWGKLQPTTSTPADLARIWAQHGPIVEAIANRDAREAEHLMRMHIEEVQLVITTAQDARPRASVDG